MSTFLLAAGVINANWVCDEIWARSVLYYPDEWIARFPTWYSELYHAAVYLSHLAASLGLLAIGLLGGIWLGRRLRLRRS